MLSQDYASAKVVFANSKIGRLRLPKKKTYRTLSIAQYLRDQGKAFEWFTKNSISIDLPVKDSSERKRTMFITGSLTCYKIRIDIWSFVNGGDFTYHEFTENHGRALVFHLVAKGFLPNSYLPTLSPFPYAD